MHVHELRDHIQDALDQSIKWSRDNAVSNSTRSAYFSSQVGRRLSRLVPGAKLFQVDVDDVSRERKPGEWLLDAVVAELDGARFVKTVHVAMECESSTSMGGFAWDFGKLLNIKSHEKLYLHGLNHSSSARANTLVTERLDIAARLIQDLDPGTKWFFGFWPSPEKVKNFPSIWDSFGVSRQYDHLSLVRLFEFDGTSFAPAT